MNVNLDLIPGFLATHGRLLDRRRHELLMGGGEAGALAALEGYRNPDGGYGWGLEPDLRSPESQPGAALHAFEVFEEVAPRTSPAAVALCDWLESVTLPDGGLPFALPLTVTDGTAPWWAGADHATSALQITSVSAAAAHRVARHDPAVAAHPWLARATRYSLDAIEALEERPHAYVLSFAVGFLDAVHDTEPRAAGLLKRLAAGIPADGRVPVEGGTADETLRPLDFAPFPGRPARGLFAPEVIAADLVRLAGEQQDDGGWTVDYARISPAGSLEWRGAATVRSLRILRANGVV
ncbi:hypothetical protein MF672_038185 [Actinomadura sp. ATCC 31491]|uniref:Prenyltransferase n=1 Tax=Actinomadura luzonensis TaxID=2805427 RepID=A0ABT0G664_9ACTN|nr:hypothetical protein [Actinomadura luzonensis]MCK2219583.1 hypothetical protein [Actinomadura luzonensis]